MGSDTSAAPAVQDDEPAQVLHALLDDLEALDMARAAACFAEEAILELPYAPDGFPGYHLGRKAIAAFLQPFPR